MDKLKKEDGETDKEEKKDEEKGVAVVSEIKDEEEEFPSRLAVKRLIAQKQDQEYGRNVAKNILYLVAAILWSPVYIALSLYYGNTLSESALISLTVGACVWSVGIPICEIVFFRDLRRGVRRDLEIEEEYQRQKKETVNK